MAEPPAEPRPQDATDGGSQAENGNGGGGSASPQDSPSVSMSSAPEAEQAAAMQSQAEGAEITKVCGLFINRKHCSCSKVDSKLIYLFKWKVHVW